MLIGDARTTIQVVQASGFQVDAIFLDQFSPPNCPQLWTVEFLEQVAKCLSSTGRLATYSCTALRTALLAAGLKIGFTPPVGRRSTGTVATAGLLTIYRRYRSKNKSICLLGQLFPTEIRI